MTPQDTDPHNPNPNPNPHAYPGQIDNPMAYIDTDDPAVIARYTRINAAAKMVYDVILQDCPQSAERTLAIRKLQEARMWADAAIAFDGKTYPR